MLPPDQARDANFSDLHEESNPAVSTQIRTEPEDECDPAQEQYIFSIMTAASKTGFAVVHKVTEASRPDGSKGTDIC